MSFESIEKGIEEGVNEIFDSHSDESVTKKIVGELGEKEKLVFDREELVSFIKKWMERCVVEKIKEEKGFESISYETFMSKFVNGLTPSQIESVVNGVFFMTSDELIEICNIMGVRDIKDMEDKKKCVESIKKIMEIVVKRGGGNKKYWRDVLERVKNWEIDDINKMIERKIDESMEW